MENEPKPGWAFLAVFFAPVLGLPLLLAGVLELKSDVSTGFDLSKAVTTDPVEEPAPKDKLVYLPITRDIDIPLPNDLGRLRAEVVAVMTDVDEEIMRLRLGPDLTKASTTLLEAAAGLAETLHDAGRLDSELAALRAELPVKLKDTINSELEKIDLGDGIREVLIMKWAVAPSFERPD